MSHAISHLTLFQQSIHILVDKSYKGFSYSLYRNFTQQCALLGIYNFGESQEYFLLLCHKVSSFFWTFSFLYTTGMKQEKKIFRHRILLLLLLLYAFCSDWQNWQFEQSQSIRKWKVKYLLSEILGYSGQTTYGLLLAIIVCTYQ